MQVVRSVGNLVASFSDPQLGARPELDLGLPNESLETQEKHFKVFMKCLFKALKYNLGEAYNQEMHFAWKAFAFQAALCVRQHIAHRPLSAADITRIGTLKRGSLAKLMNNVPDSWVDRSANLDEETAATKIQASFRGHFLRKLATAYINGELSFLLYSFFNDGSVYDDGNNWESDGKDYEVVVLYLTIDIRRMISLATVK